MDRYRIPPDTKVNLSNWKADDQSAFPGNKKDSRPVLKGLVDEISTLQEVLYAEQKHPILIILQGMDTAGKDGTIRHVFEGVNPQGVNVTNFKVPSTNELSHDYLWRVHRSTPRKGEIRVFNRSHYEDVLVVRVHKLVPEDVWSKRYSHIVNFERMLVDEGTTILKFFLHISFEEQRERLQARLDEPDKRWKFKLGDLEKRRLWPKYMQAYEDVLSRTSTSWAPWYIVPGDRKWYRNLVVASTIAATLRGLEMEFPASEDNLDGVVVT